MLKAFIAPFDVCITGVMHVCIRMEELRLALLKGVKLRSEILRGKIYSFYGDDILVHSRIR